MSKITCRHIKHKDYTVIVSTDEDVFLLRIPSNRGHLNIAIFLTIQHTLWHNSRILLYISTILDNHYTAAISISDIKIIIVIKEKVYWMHVCSF